MSSEGTADSYDVIVVGSGAGLVGAYAAAARGLRTLVIEKTEYVGGTTALAPALSTEGLFAAGHGDPGRTHGGPGTEPLQYGTMLCRAGDAPRHRSDPGGSPGDRSGFSRHPAVPL
nr:FAD-binding protein [Streptomyces sp. NBC_00886]